MHGEDEGGLSSRRGLEQGLELRCEDVVLAAADVSSVSEEGVEADVAGDGGDDEAF